MTREQCILAKKIPDDCMPKCASCAFFVCELKEDIGMCKRYPPVVLYIGDEEFDSSFPVIPRSEWCGEFVRKTN